MESYSEKELKWSDIIWDIQKLIVSLMLKGIIEKKNFVRKPRQSYEAQIRKSTGCKITLRDEETNTE